MKTIVLTSAALKDLFALPSEARDAIDDGLARYAVSGLGDVKKLAADGGYRLRIGRYRVLFDEDAVTILAFQIGKRETTTYSRLGR